MRSGLVGVLLCFLACESVFGSVQIAQNMNLVNLQTAANPFEAAKSALSQIMEQIPLSGIKLSDDMVMGWLWVLAAFLIVCGGMAIFLLVEVIRAVVNLGLVIAGKKPWVSGPFYPHQHILLLVFATVYAAQRGLFATVFAAIQLVIGKFLELFMVDETPEIFAYFLAHGLVWGSDKTEEFRKFAERFLQLLPTKTAANLAVDTVTKQADSLELLIQRLKAINEHLLQLKQNADDYKSSIDSALDKARQHTIDSFPNYNTTLPDIPNPFEGYPMAPVPPINPLIPTLPDSSTPSIDPSTPSTPSDVSGTQPTVPKTTLPTSPTFPNSSQ
eukprot:c418_g1_i1.p1 GENE.c418_g1_i1~~c418_g1_i1.p1  ORF type:complete len:329 (-),score=105.92 c418_g1_i1:62-1048(-)